MTHEINQILERVDVGFRVSPGDGLSFTAEFQSGVKQPMQRLSGGQQSLLAVAFWLGMAAVFDSPVKLLVLDEPTHDLDEANQRQFGLMLERLHSVIRDRDLQVIMVTHAKTLVSDSVVSLGGRHGKLVRDVG